MSDTTTCAHGVPLGPDTSCAACDQACQEIDRYGAVSQ